MDSNKSLVDVVEYEDKTTIFTQVGNNPIVVGMILQYLGKADLLQYRKVSHLWNNEAVRLLRKTTTNEFIARFDESVFFDGLHRNLHELACKTPEWKNKLETFHALLKDSQHPELLMKSVFISHVFIERWKAFPLKIRLYRHILRRYGFHVKELVIEDHGQFQLLSRCLGNNGFCPNLEELKLKIRIECDDDLPYIQNMGSFKIKKIKFSYWFRTVETPESTVGLLKVFDAILENSCGLESLTVKAITLGKDAKTDMLIEVLKSKPHVTTSLKTFSMSGHLQDNFHPLCGIQFGSKLKHIDLCDEFRELQTKTTERQRKGMEKFLTVVSNLLESFSFTLDCVFSLRQIPWMPKLKELTFIRKCKTKPPLSFKFLENLPALRKLDLRLGDISVNEHLLESPALKLPKPGALNQVPRLVHQGLEIIDNYSVMRVESPRTICHLNVAFPNLSVLRIRPKLPDGCSCEEARMWFEQSFLIISQMRNLQSLSVSFDNLRCEHLELDLNEAFSYLRETPNLKTVEFFTNFGNKFNTPVVAASLPVLIEASKLSTILFHCYPEMIKNQNLKMKIRQLIKLFDTSKINLLFEYPEI